MAEPLGLRCAAESLGPDEPLIGTASGSSAGWSSSNPGRGAPRRSTRASSSRRRHRPSRGRQGQGERVLLARRPGERGDGDRRCSSPTPAPERAGSSSSSCRAAPRAACSTSTSARSPSPTRPGRRPGPAGLELVCTNGRHDPCCADKGRPVVRALAAPRGGPTCGSPPTSAATASPPTSWACPTASTTAGSSRTRPPPWWPRTGPGDRPRPLPGPQPPAAAGPGGRALRPPAPGRAPDGRADRAVDRAGPRRHGGRACSSGAARRSRWSSSGCGSPTAVQLTCHVPGT